MSVINKMLRDLDSRRSGVVGAISGQSPAMAGVSSVRGRKSSEDGRMSKVWRFFPLVLFLVLGVVAAGWWYLGGGMEMVSPSKPMTDVTSASGQVPTPIAVSAPQETASTTATSSGEPPKTDLADAAAPASELKAEALTMPAVAKAEKASKTDEKTNDSVIASREPAPAKAVTNTSSKAPSMASEKASVDAKEPVAQRESVSVAAPTPKRPPPSHAVPPASRPLQSAAKPPQNTLAGTAPVPDQAATLQVLAQAQSLWNSGGREPAIDLLRKAVTLAERSISPASEPAALSVFASLVSELTRMELVQGHVKEAWDLLVHLEPVISGQADLWAVRGNAAQRLGRHTDSATSYLNALKLRPGEPRWMLGAAVSLAVQGKTGLAAELADKARASGVVNPEVVAYLRQLGVPLFER